MLSNFWDEKQRRWQEERTLHFQDGGPINNNTGHHTHQEKTKVDYQLCNVTIKDNQLFFSGFPENKDCLDLVLNTTYIFDVSHPSNYGHQFVISRVPASGKVKDLTYQGIAGTPGGFVSIYIGEGRPTSLYYYDEKLKGCGGQINILDI